MTRAHLLSADCLPGKCQGLSTLHLTRCPAGFLVSWMRPREAVSCEADSQDRAELGFEWTKTLFLTKLLRSVPPNLSSFRENPILYLTPLRSQQVPPLMCKGLALF